MAANITHSLSVTITTSRTYYNLSLSTDWLILTTTIHRDRLTFCYYYYNSIQYFLSVSIWQCSTVCEWSTVCWLHKRTGCGLTACIKNCWRKDLISLLSSTLTCHYPRPNQLMIHSHSEQQKHGCHLAEIKKLLCSIYDTPLLWNNITGVSSDTSC